MPRSRNLTDDQTWHLLHSSEAPADELAAAFGVSKAAIRVSRWRLGRDGWTCSVRYGVCGHCGEPLTMQAAIPGHRYHDNCREAAYKARQRAYDTTRVSTPEKLAQRLDVVHRWSRETQTETKKQATKSGRPWTEADDALVIQMIDHPIKESCQILQRTMRAVAARRTLLRKTARAAARTEVDQ